MNKLAVNVEELWHNTYIKGRKYSNPIKNSALGRAYRETAALWNEGQDPDFLDTPLAHFFLSDDCGRFQGTEHIAHGFLKSYTAKFKELFESIKTRGYTRRRGTIPVEVIDGEPYLFDGNKRIACIVAIGEQKEITVKLADYTISSKKCRTYAEKILKIHYLKPEGEKVLYQPILDAGLDDYSSDTLRRGYRLAIDRLLGICGDVKGKRVLDVGCGYGHYSREFAKAGAYVTGVEKDVDAFGLCRNLIPLYPNMDWSNPLYAYCDISKYIGKTSLTFDFALLLNVFHRMYAKNEAHAWKTLDKIAKKSGFILLTMSMSGPKKIGEQKDIPGLITENSILNTYKDFGPLPPFGRRLFGFWQ